MAVRNSMSRKRRAIARKSCKACSAFGFDRITGRNPTELSLFSPARFLNTSCGFASSRFFGIAEHTYHQGCLPTIRETQPSVPCGCHQRTDRVIDDKNRSRPEHRFDRIIAMLLSVRSRCLRAVWRRKTYPAALSSARNWSTSARSLLASSDRDLVAERTLADAVPVSSALWLTDDTLRATSVVLLPASLA